MLCVVARKLCEKHNSWKMVKEKKTDTTHAFWLFIYFIMKCSICDLSVPNDTENYYVCVIYVVYLNYCIFCEKINITFEQTIGCSFFSKLKILRPTNM